MWGRAILERFVGHVALIFDVDRITITNVLCKIQRRT